MSEQTRCTLSDGRHNFNRWNVVNRAWTCVCGAMATDEEAEAQPSLTPADLIALRDKLRGLKFQVNDTRLWNSTAHARNDFARIANEIGNAADQLDTLITRLSSETEKK